MRRCQRSLDSTLVRSWLHTASVPVQILCGQCGYPWYLSCCRRERLVADDRRSEAFGQRRHSRRRGRGQKLGRHARGLLAAPGCVAGRGRGAGRRSDSELAGYRKFSSRSSISASGATWPGVLLPALQGSSLIPAIEHEYAMPTAGTRTQPRTSAAVLQGK